MPTRKGLETPQYVRNELSALISRFGVKFDSLSEESKKIVTELIKLKNLSEDEQKRSLNDVGLIISNKLANINEKITDIENQIAVLEQFSSVDTTSEDRANQLRASVVDLTTEGNFLGEIYQFIQDNDLAQIVDFVRDDALSQMNKELDKKKAGVAQETREKLRNNQGLRFLEQSGFDPEILYLDTTQIEDINERQKRVEEKYRYIESAIISSLFSSIALITNPNTLMLPEPSSIQLEIPPIGGQDTRTFGLTTLVEQIGLAALETEQIRVGELKTHVNEWLDTMSSWIASFKAFAKAENIPDLINAIPDSAGTEFLNPSWLWDSEVGRTALSDAPPLMVRLKKEKEDGTKFFEWKFVSDDNLLSRLTNYLSVYMNNCRYSLGFAGNTVLFNLDKRFNSDGRGYNEAPFMWRVSGPSEDDEYRLSLNKLFSPSIYIAPAKDNPFGLTPLLPHTLYAKPTTNDTRTRDIDAVFRRDDNLPDNIINRDGKLFYVETDDLGRVSEHEIDSNGGNTLVAARYFAEILTELGGFSSVGDTLVGYVNDPEEVMKELNKPISQRTRIVERELEKGTVVVPSVEGKFILSRIWQIIIAIKYAINPLGGDEVESPEQFGKFKRSLLAVLGPKCGVDFFDHFLIGGPDPREGMEDKFFIGSLRDWLTITKGNYKLIPLDQITEKSTEKFATLRNFILRIIQFVYDEKTPFTQIMEMVKEEFFVSGVNDDYINTLIGLNRYIRAYVFGETDGDGQTEPILKSVVSKGFVNKESQETLKTMGIANVINKIVAELTREGKAINETSMRDKLVELGVVTTKDEADSYLQKHLKLIHKDLNTRSDYLCRVLVRNTDTGEVKYVDTAIHQYFQMRPSILLNQASDYQLTDIRSKKNPKGKHYAKWLDYGSDGWQEAFEVIEAAPNMLPEEKKLWKSYIANPEEHPMRVLVINVGGEKNFNERTGKYEAPKGKTRVPSPKEMIANAIFFGAVGANNAEKGDVVKRMTHAQQAALEIALSKDARYKYVWDWYSRVGGATVRRFGAGLARHLLGFFGFSHSEKTGQREMPSQMTLPDVGDRGVINRFLAMLGSKSTLDEILKEAKGRETLEKIFGLKS